MNVDVNVGNKNNSQKRNGDEAKKRKSDNRIRTRTPKYDNYTELNSSIENIYLPTQGIEQYKKPTEKEKRSDKFSMCHETHSHNTNECRHLRNMIKELIHKKIAM